MSFRPKYFAGVLILSCLVPSINSMVQIFKFGRKRFDDGEPGSESLTLDSSDNDTD